MKAIRVLHVLVLTTIAFSLASAWDCSLKCWWPDWRSGQADSSRNNFFLGFAYDGSYVGIFKGTRNDIQEMIWHEDATWSSDSVLSVADPLVFFSSSFGGSVSLSKWCTFNFAHPNAFVLANDIAYRDSYIWPDTSPRTATPTSIPSAAPSPVPSPSPTESLFLWYQTAETLQLTPGSSCSSNPDCFDWDGDCCPTTHGKFLACCDHYDPKECKPYSLSLHQHDLPFIKEGWVCHCPEDDTLQLEQWSMAIQPFVTEHPSFGKPTTNTMRQGNGVRNCKEMETLSRLVGWRVIGGVHQFGKVACPGQRLGQIHQYFLVLTALVDIWVSTKAVRKIQVSGSERLQPTATCLHSSGTVVVGYN